MTVESNFILPHIPDDKLASVRAAVKVWCVLCCKKKNKTKKNKLASVRAAVKVWCVLCCKEKERREKKKRTLICCASLRTLPHCYY
jgi:hypothetical protein